MTVKKTDTLRFGSHFHVTYSKYRGITDLIVCFFNCDLKIYSANEVIIILINSNVRNAESYYLQKRNFDEREQESTDFN